MQVSAFSKTDETEIELDYCLTTDPKTEQKNIPGTWYIIRIPTINSLYNIYGNETTYMLSHTAVTWHKAENKRGGNNNNILSASYFIFHFILLFYTWYPLADGEKQSSSSPHLPVFSYMSSLSPAVRKIFSTHRLSCPARPAPPPMINWCILSKTVRFLSLKDS